MDFLKQPPDSGLRGYKFAAFEVDLRAGEIRRNGARIKLQEQPFQVLAVLLQCAPEVVTREELSKRLWDDETFVEFDHGLNNAISRIREALGDSAEKPRFIETLPKRGYRFIVPVEQIVASRVPGPDPGLASSPAALERSVAQTARQNEPAQPAPQPSQASRLWLRVAVVAGLIVALATLFGAHVYRSSALPSAGYVQITNFSDAAFSPAISPDGRMIAFIRGSDATFPTVGEVYTKLLPNGEPVQRTHDGWPKYSVSFSADGSQIAYTAATNRRWDTETLPVLGGDPQLLLSNAAGLTWLDDRHVLFSQIKSGLHMGLVTATDTRLEPRDIYLPEHERGMAHYSYASPDRKWILVVEMGPTGAWARCRLVPFDGSSPGSQVGPAGLCTSAGWSPDGKWMYFSAIVKGASHLWRQPFPKGEPEQLTFGPTEETGVAVALDGRSLLSAVGMRDSGLWLHDARGEHLLSSEGYASAPSFSADGHVVYYLLRRESPQSPRELWMTNLNTGKSEPLVQGFSIFGYDVSADGKQAVFSALPVDGPSQLWLASCDRSFATRLLASSGEDEPSWGPDGDIVFRQSERGQNFIFRMRLDGSERRQATAGPIIAIQGVSPDRRWVLAMAAVDGVPSTAVIAVSLRDGAARRICPATCMAKWSPDGARFYVEPLQGAASGRTAVMAVPAGKSLPDLPAAGIGSTEDAAALPGSTVIDLSALDPSHMGQNIVAPGLAETFIYAKATVHRNLFQIPLP